MPVARFRWVRDKSVRITNGGASPGAGSGGDRENRRANDPPRIHDGPPLSFRPATGPTNWPPGAAMRCEGRGKEPWGKNGGRPGSDGAGSRGRAGPIALEPYQVSGEPYQATGNEPYQDQPGRHAEVAIPAGMARTEISNWKSRCLICARAQGPSWCGCGRHSCRPNPQAGFVL